MLIISIKIYIPFKKRIINKGSNNKLNICAGTELVVFVSAIHYKSSHGVNGASPVRTALK